MSNDPNKAMFEARMRGNKFGRFVNSQLESGKELSPEEAVDAMFSHFDITAEMISVKDGEIVKERIVPENLYNTLDIISAQSKIAAEEGNKAFL